VNYSDNIRNLRLQRGLTQMQMAEDLGTSQSSITSWETGRREPDFATFKKLAAYFNVPLSALLPKDDTIGEELVSYVAESLNANPKLYTLYSQAKFLSNENLDTLISVATALSKEKV